MFTMLLRQPTENVFVSLGNVAFNTFRLQLAMSNQHHRDWKQRGMTMSQQSWAAGKIRYISLFSDTTNNQPKEVSKGNLESHDWKAVYPDLNQKGLVHSFPKHIYLGTHENIAKPIHWLTLTKQCTYLYKSQICKQRQRTFWHSLKGKQRHERFIDFTAVF